MASVIALLTKSMVKDHGTPVPGAVLPIAHYPEPRRRQLDTGEITTETVRTSLSRGGSLYIVAPGELDELWLVAILEAPESSGIKVGDKRKPGWYAPPNIAPVTDLSKLRRKLGLTKDLEASLESPLELAPGAEAAIRELLGDTDAPVLGITESPSAQPPPPVVTGPPLARAVAYLAASHLVPAIDAMLEAWRDSRVPALADLIDRATRALPLHDRPMFTRRCDNENESHAMWVEIFASNRGAAMPQLLQNLFAGDTWKKQHIHKRLQKLEALPPDPRIARRIVEHAPLAARDGSSASLKSELKILETTRDVRGCEYLVEVATDAYAPKAPRLFAFAKDPGRKFGRWPLELDDDDADQVTAIEAALERLEEPLRTERNLVDAIAEHPDDDGSRQVYADWLLERGHPRGEYLALAMQQDRGVISAASARRLAALVEVPYLFGALDDIASSRLRKRDRGIDRTLDVYWVTSLAWHSAACHPLVRAIETVNIVGTVRPERTHGMAAFILAAPRLQTINHIAVREANVLLPLLGKQFRHTRDKLTRVGRPR